MSENSSLVSARGGIEDVPPTPHHGKAFAQRPEIRLLSLSDLMALPTLPDLVRGVLQEQSFAVLYGKPETAKTFLALDVGLCVATGDPWHGHEVTRGPVVYIAGEGARNLPLRILAWLGSRPPALRDQVQARFRVVPDSVEFFSSSLDVLKERLRALPDKPRLIIVDTLARCFLGADESLASDMGIFVARCDELRREFGATVLVVHHRSREGEERGSSALRGAADTMLVAERHSDLVTIRCTKQKDAEPMAPLAFRLERVRVGHGADGSEISSCRLSPSEPRAVPTRAARNLAPLKESDRVRVAKALRDESRAEPVDAARLRQVTGLGRSNQANHLKALVDTGCASKTGNGKAIRYEFVRLPDATELADASS